MQTVDKHTFLKGKNVNVPRSELALHTWPNHFELLKKGELMGQNEQQQAEIVTKKILSLRVINNYVDNIVPSFDHLPTSSGQLWKFYILPSLCSRDHAWTFY